MATEITGDTRHFIEESVKACEDAARRGVSILIRNDDEEIIVTNATSSEMVTSLGKALACGYGGEED